MEGELPAEIVAALNRPVDAGERYETRHARIGSLQLALRRDCHGVLRRLEICFPSEQRAHLRTALARSGTWSVVVPDELELLDAPGLGRIVLCRDRLEMTLRLAASAAAAKEILEAVVDAGASQPGASPTSPAENRA